MRIYCILLSLVLLSCQQIEKHKVNQAEKIDPPNFTQADLLGTWLLNKEQVNYPTLDFYPDSTAIFGSYCDTIYRFTYKTLGDTLVLKDLNDNVRYNRIKIINDSVLVFYNLIDLNEEQVYRRRKSNSN